MGHAIFFSQRPNGRYARDQDTILYLLADDARELEIDRFGAVMINLHKITLRHYRDLR